MKKHKRAPQTFKPGSDAEHFDVYRRCRTELHRLAAIGRYHDDPELWHPAARLAALSEDADCSASLRFLIWKELLQYIEVPKAVGMRQLDGPGSVAISIEIVRADGGADQVIARRVAPIMVASNGTPEGTDR